MLTKSILIVIFVLNCLFKSSLQQFNSKMESEYINKFDLLKRDSYSENLPQGFACKDNGHVNQERIVSIKDTTTSNDIQNRCSSNVICQIESSAEVTMNSNLNLAGLIVKGQLNWNDQTQSTPEQWLCSGYIAVINYFRFKMKFSF